VAGTAELAGLTRRFTGAAREVPVEADEPLVAS
jgi:hypothetical protein